MASTPGFEPWPGPPSLPKLFSTRETFKLFKMTANSVDRSPLKCNEHKLSRSVTWKSDWLMCLKDLTNSSLLKTRNLRQIFHLLCSGSLGIEKVPGSTCSCYFVEAQQPQEEQNPVRRQQEEMIWESGRWVTISVHCHGGSVAVQFNRQLNTIFLLCYFKLVIIHYQRKTKPR